MYNGCDKEKKNTANQSNKVTVRVPHSRSTIFIFIFLIIVTINYGRPEIDAKMLHEKSTISYNTIDNRILLFEYAPTAEERPSSVRFSVDRDHV